MPGDELRPDAGPPAPRRDEVMTPEERAALAKDVQEQVPQIVDESEAAVRAMLNDDGSMTKPLAMAYVQQKAIDLFDDLAAGYRLAAENQQAPEVDRKDAALCATCCDEAATAMRLATTMLLRSQERVQVAPATATPIRVPGSKLPRGGR
jgi:hypothetical protein